MKKILFVDSSFGSGGAEHQCTQLMNMLVEKGYQVTALTFGDITDHYYLSPMIVRKHLAPQKSTFQKILAVERFLLFAKADVVIAFSQRLSVLTLFPLLLRPFIKVISSERNYTNGRSDKFEKILIRTKIYQRANYIIPNNYSQGHYLSNIMPSIANRIHVITNFTDINTYKSTPVPNNEVTRIGIFCRFEKQKNFHRFLEALHMLNQKRKIKYHVDWYGNHTFTNKEQILYYEQGLSMIVEYVLEPYFSIHDATKEVDKLIPSFDVMCLPSLHEGFSNSISEYICCGRPVICSDVSDNHVMVHEDENGFLFDPLNVNSIVDALCRYFDTDYNKRNSMGINSRSIAESLFDKENFINSYIKLIES